MLNKKQTITTYLCAAAAALLAVSAPVAFAQLIVLDDFNNTGGTIDLATWADAGFGRTEIISNSYVEWQPNIVEDTDWAIGEVDSQTVFYMPITGEPLTRVRWVLGPGEIVVADTNQNSHIRYQLGIVSANDVLPAGDGLSMQYWQNGEGGIWFDIDGITDTNPTTVTTRQLAANDSKNPSTENGGIQVRTDYVMNWDWANSNRTIMVELRRTRYDWFVDGVIVTGAQWSAHALNNGEWFNGFRIMALGQNQNNSRGRQRIDRIEIENPHGAGAIVSFQAVPNTLVGGAPFTLNYEVEPSATAWIDQGIGLVAHTGGVGALVVVSAPVTTPTATLYTLIASNSVEVATNFVTVTSLPRPHLQLADFDDHFLGTALDTNLWETRGPKTMTVSNSYVHFADDGGNWDHGEVDTIIPYGIPGPGESTEITFVIGPGEITSTNAGLGMRYVVGLVSANEPSGFSYQQFNNTEGGIWMEIEFSDTDTNAAGGNFYYANNTKETSSTADQLATFGLPNWGWTESNRSVTLRLTDLGFFWYDDATTNLMAAGSWDLAGLDHELWVGYYLMAQGVNYNTGRAATSFDRVTATSVTTNFSLTSIQQGASVTVQWENDYPSDAGLTGATYSVERAPDANSAYSTIASALPQASNSYTDTNNPPNGASYGVTMHLPEGALEGCGIFSEGFEGVVSEWSEIFYTGANSIWEIGAPTATNGPASAFTGANVYGTVLAGDYPTSVDVALRTPIIDLTGKTEATLSWFQWYNIEDGLDFGEVYLLNSAGTPLIVAPIADFTGTSGGNWVLGLLAMPPEAFTAGQVRLEFRLVSDGAIGAPGWFLDEICVE